MKQIKLLMLIASLTALVSCQKPVEYFMTLSDKEFTVEADGGVVTFTLSANTYVRVNNDMDWATLDEGTKSGDVTTYTLNVTANSATEKRVGTIRFIGDGVTPLKFTLTQKALVPVGVTPTSIDVERTATSTKFTVLGDKDWTATSDNPAFTLNPTKGTGETEVTVTFPENESTELAVAHITVKIGAQDYSLVITQAAVPKKEYTDLSAKGTSNCYIVSGIGYYKFKATVAGNGYVPASCEGEIASTIEPASASVLWSTYNTTVAPASNDEILKGVELKDGYVQFNTDLNTFVNANVVIAAYNGAGTIVWSWHIWLTDDPAVTEIGGSIWMDRNLGAVVANIKGDARSCGLLYQWGRKDPMRGPSTYTDGDFIATYPAMTEQEIAVTAETTIATSIANPRPFINTYPGGAGPKDWIWTKDHTDRWMDNQKTMFDPCPQGYKLPSTAQMGQFGLAGGIPEGSVKYSANETARAAYNVTDHVFETAVWSLPMCGYISYNDGTAMVDYGIGARYVTSSDNAAKVASVMYLNANATACNFANNATPGHASAARCVKE